MLKSAILFQYLLDSETQTISDSAIMGGISLSLYAEKCTRYLFDRELGESVHQSKQRKLVEYIAQRGGTVNRKQLLSSKILDGGHNEYDYVITSLEESGRLHMERLEGKTVSGSRIILMEHKK